MKRTMAEQRRINAEQKKLKLEEYKDKGLEWCAKTLLATKEEAAGLRAQLKTVEREKRQENTDYFALKEANDAMAEVLEKNGIRPTRLRITYIETDCENCPFYSDEDDERDCWGCGETYRGSIVRGKEKICTQGVGFYTYLIDGNFLKGITAQFENVEYDLIKVVDERTGEVIGEWEYQNEEQDNGQSRAPEGGET